MLIWAASDRSAQSPLTSSIFLVAQASTLKRIAALATGSPSPRSRSTALSRARRKGCWTKSAAISAPVQCPLSPRRAEHWCLTRLAMSGLRRMDLCCAPSGRARRSMFMGGQASGTRPITAAGTVTFTKDSCASSPKSGGRLRRTARASVVRSRSLRRPPAPGAPRRAGSPDR